jgi:TolB-like protein/lipoprotein NlpI
MASLIPGFEYDVFISYRQKDNKHDGWVTEFVDNLKGELESTFKEEISVYFDINPHDGLLETHDVDESLKEKLKCLVFIPIISRTYCDPKSFAWEHEFKAFVELASQDKFGLKVKLPNGNVASRVLPVRIHDLEVEDIKIIEGVTGTVLRTLDFVFKTASGVNRPLKSKEDHPGDNLNKTYYQDQINKVALAIKEIMHGMQSELFQVVKNETQTKITFEETSSEEKRSKTKTTVISTGKKPLVTIVITAFLIIAGILLNQKIFKRDRFEAIRNADGKISVAVIPFENLTGDTTLNWFRKGISSLIINGLGNSAELAVCDDHTMFEVMEGMNQVYAAGISPSLASEIAGKAKAETYISGSFQGREGTYWILANLVNTETGNILWTNKVEGNLKSSVYLDLADSLCNEIRNYLEIKVLHESADFEFREAYPKSAEAYRYFIEGMSLVLNQNYKSGIQSLKKALEIDSTFTLASFYVAYAFCYSNQDVSLVDEWIKKTYAMKERIPSKYQIWIEMWYACGQSKSYQEISNYCDQLAESGINTRLLWSDLGVTYVDFLHQYEKAAAACENVLQINPEQINNWKYLIFWDRFILALHKTGQHKREKEVAEIALKILPGNSNFFFYRMAVCALSHGNTSEANEILVKYKSKHKDLVTPEDYLEQFLGQMYEEAGLMDQAEIHYRQAYELNPQNTDHLYNLALFLINNGINIIEGMELVNKYLEKNPVAENFLRLKGWCLYKQGKYEEAVQLLENVWKKWNGFDINLYEYLTEAKKAVAGQK